MVLMAAHLDIKVFADILQEIRKVHSEGKRHSSISTTIDVIGASDTDGETEEKDLLKPGQTPVFLTPNSPRKVHPPIIKKVQLKSNILDIFTLMALKSSTATNLVKQLGMDHDMIKEMIADG